VRPDELIRVGVAYPFPSETLASLQAVSPRLSIRSSRGSDQSAIDEVTDDGVDVLIGQQLPGSANTLAGLSWLQVLSAGVDHVLTSGRLPGRVTLTNARGAYAGSMSQFAISALLRTAEPITERFEAQANASWPNGTFDLASQRLRGRTLVLIGYGSIGREVARIADVLGLRILAVKADPDRLVDDSFRLPGTGDPEGRIPERVVGVEGIHDVVSEADYVLITLPGTSRSRGLVDADVLAALPRHAWVINIGRGTVIDEPALVEALQTGAIAGATLDVFAVEPLPPESPLWHLPNVFITPHVAGAGAEREVALLVAENLRRFVAGETLLNVIDRDRGY
jgi:phosphoglycerate dehydrogenase-like enzyme